MAFQQRFDRALIALYEFDYLSVSGTPFDVMINKWRVTLAGVLNGGITPKENILQTWREWKDYTHKLDGILGQQASLTPLGKALIEFANTLAAYLESL